MLGLSLVCTNCFGYFVCSLKLIIQLNDYTRDWSEIKKKLTKCF